MTAEPFLARHFWKAFAMLALSAVAYAGYRSGELLDSKKLLGRIEVSAYSTTGTAPAQDDDHLRELISNQSKAATVTLKHGQPVTGYLYRYDHWSLWLGTIRPTDTTQEMETVLIPWENVVSIRASQATTPAKR